MKKIICIGSATRDMFVEMPETRIIDNSGDVTAKKLMAFEFGAKEYAESLREEVGGSAVNVAAGLAKTDLRPFVFSRTSKSEEGKWILKKISRLGVKKNYMQQQGKENSQTSIVISDKKNMDHVILRTGDSIKNFDLEKAVEKFREKTDWIFVASQKENWQENWEIIKNFAEEKKAKIALNPSGYQISETPKEFLKAFEDVDVIILNRDEALELVKNTKGEVKDEIRELVRELIHEKNKALVITDGAEGAFVSGGEEIYHLGISADQKNDTVGAGDAFSSGFLSGFIESENIKQALAWGIANSGAVISKFGATEGLLKRKEMKRKGEELVAKVEKI